MPLNLLAGARRSTGPKANRKCTGCGYALLAAQTRCPECGAVTAAPVAVRGRVTQLYQQGPATVWPIAIRFAIMGVLASTGPSLILLLGVLAIAFDIGSGPNFGGAIALLMAPLPLVVLLSMPFGPGSIGGPNSPIPVERATLLGVQLHTLALITSPSWWVIAALLHFGSPSPITGVLFLLAVIGAGVSAYAHLCWLADLGLALTDDGPHGVLNICVGTAIFAAIVAVLAGLFVASWGPFFVAIGVVVLSVVLGEIWAAVQLSRGMISTLVASYEEIGREQRRAQRAAEHDQRFR